MTESTPLTSPTIPAFLASSALRTDSPPAAVLVGIPYDAAVSYRGGAKAGPDGIRRASDSIEEYCPRLDRQLGQNGAYHVDAGNIPESQLHGSPQEVCDRVQDSLSRLQSLHQQAPLLVMGGDHLVALPSLRSAITAHPDLQIIHIDAHGDIRQDWQGETHSHATVLRRALDLLAAPGCLHRWGIRSGTREEFQMAAEDPRIVDYSPDLRGGLELMSRVLDTRKPIYVTLDVDGIDPADIPGTGTPEPGGLRFSDVEHCLGRLVGAGRLSPDAPPRLVGADVVELAPELDPTGRSEVAVARLLRTLLLCFEASREKVSARAEASVDG